MSTDTKAHNMTLLLLTCVHCCLNWPIEVCAGFKNSNGILLDSVSCEHSYCIVQKRANAYVWCGSSCGRSNP